MRGCRLLTHKKRGNGLSFMPASRVHSSEHDKMRRMSFIVLMMAGKPARIE